MYCAGRWDFEGFAHNCKSFDCRVLLNKLSLCGAVDRLKAVVLGFADTLPAFKEAHPGLKSYSLENLVSAKLSATYAAHDAVADVDALSD